MNKYVFKLILFLVVITSNSQRAKNDLPADRANRKASISRQYKSAITDHIAQENHVIDWEGAMDRDSNTNTRRIREAIHLSRRGGGEAINRDDRTMFLDHVYDPLLKTNFEPEEWE